MRRIKIDSHLDIRISQRVQAEKEIAAILAANPQIGVLQSAGGQRFYTASPYREAKHPSQLISAKGC